MDGEPRWPARGLLPPPVLDAVRYLVENGIKWRSLTVDFPPWPRVYAFFRRWRDHGLSQELHDRLRERVRSAEGREAEPTAAIVDSQSVKADATVRNASRGYDGGKKVNGRKRHLITDCPGLLLDMLVTPASTTDRDAARTTRGSPVSLWGSDATAH
ncbi:MULTISPECIES: transposase [unclassified Streptomyces]|uniref:transposase n=1 Tax=unclassified Streptomyces TaxID=2593676 RepID=UPI00224DC601|nr:MULTISPECIES: transposase [unclassified Streptomyces]MCX4792936.1 transposase [Streptomyces sp. NBC_01242]WSP59563.1 transposase [Streptomyces sp. NBC_01241]WSP60841.1 transposase [Streptomyces sp. NBC_01240]WSU19920.1 transposase [Streptomyces sp. NBC_01108]